MLRDFFERVLESSILSIYRYRISLIPDSFIRKSYACQYAVSFLSTYFYLTSGLGEFEFLQIDFVRSVFHSLVPASYPMLLDQFVSSERDASSSQLRNSSFIIR